MLNENSYSKTKSTFKGLVTFLLLLLPIIILLLDTKTNYLDGVGKEHGHTITQFIPNIIKFIIKEETPATIIEWAVSLPWMLLFCVAATAGSYIAATTKEKARSSKKEEIKRYIEIITIPLILITFVIGGEWGTLVAVRAIEHCV